MSSNLNKPIVKICSLCLQVNNPAWENVSLNASPKIKKEMELVKEKVDQERKTHEHVLFNDSYCFPHAIAMYNSNGMDTSTLRKNDIPCLIQDTPEAENLRQNYMRGIFTQDMATQANQTTQQSNNQLTERFKKLAGIKS